MNRMNYNTSEIGNININRFSHETTRTREDEPYKNTYMNFNDHQITYKKIMFIFIEAFSFWFAIACYRSSFDFIELIAVFYTFQALLSRFQSTNFTVLSMDSSKMPDNSKPNYDDSHHNITSKMNMNEFNRSSPNINESKQNAYEAPKESFSSVHHMNNRPDALIHSEDTVKIPNQGSLGLIYSSFFCFAFRPELLFQPIIILMTFGVDFPSDLIFLGFRLFKNAIFYRFKTFMVFLALILQVYFHISESKQHSNFYFFNIIFQIKKFLTKVSIEETLVKKLSSIPTSFSNREIKTGSKYDKNKFQGSLQENEMFDKISDEDLIMKQCNSISLDSHKRSNPPPISKSSTAWTNIKRKIFHFLGFCLFCDGDRDIILAFEYFNYFLLCLNAHQKLQRRMFESFLSSKDYGNGIFSHIFLISACLYPSYFLDLHSYRKVLISICIMDSMASIVGSLKRSKNKSLLGFFAGLLSSLITEYLLTRTCDIKYHVLMSLLEYRLSWNDNVFIPLTGVVYLKFLQHRQ